MGMQVGVMRQAEMKWDEPAFGIDIARCKVGMQFAFKISVKTFG